MPDSESGRVTRATRTRPVHFRTKQLIQPATRVSPGTRTLYSVPNLTQDTQIPYRYFSLFTNLPRWWDPVEVIRALPGHGNASVGSEQRFMDPRNAQKSRHFQDTEPRAELKGVKGSGSFQLRPGGVRSTQGSESLESSSSPEPSFLLDELCVLLTRRTGARGHLDAPADSKSFSSFCC